MDIETSNKILAERFPQGTVGETLFSDTVLYCQLGYFITITGSEATIGGKFTADELEALAVWMRNAQTLSLPDIAEHDPA
jgi:hypothetical protein